MPREEVKKFFIIISIAVVLVLIGITESAKNKTSAQERFPDNQEVITPKDYFAGVSLGARAAYVFDVNKNTSIYSVNEEEKLPLASLTKIMTAIITAEHFQNLSSLGNKEQIETLMASMLIASNNGAANDLAEAVNKTDPVNFVGLMNKKAGELGLKQTFFNNPSGLDLSPKIAGGYGSASDISELLIYGYTRYPEIFSETKYSKINKNGETIENKNKLTERISGIVAGKTGLTNLAGGNLAIIYDAGDNNLFSIVVIGSSEQGRFDDVEKLINSVQNYYNNL